MKLSSPLLVFLVTMSLLCAQEKAPPKIGLVGHREYLGLLGENFSGNVFVFRYNSRLVACMSRHQFEGEAVPSEAVDLDGPPILLNKKRAFKQKDVQILPLRDQKQAVQFMDYDSDYRLKVGEELWIERGKGLGKSNGTFGKLRDRNLTDGKFSPKDGARELVLDLKTPADVRGASGSPVIQVSTGKPIGVLLAADDGKAATYIVFEPICLPAIKPAAAAADRKAESEKKTKTEAQGGGG